MQALKLSELMGALSHALDITEGQPEGHCVRCCWIGMHIGHQLALPPAQLWELYYTLLLKDLGCSSNASRICELYLTDDLSFKRDFKWVDGSLPQVLRFVLRTTGASSGLMDRLKALGSILSNGDAIAQELTQTRCTRGADIARQLRFSEGVAQGIHSLDEHWNGQGRPEALAGNAISLYARIALLAQVVDIVNSADGQAAATAEVVQRRGVSNTILDKPGKLDEAEWASVRQHAVYTESILGRISNFEELARVSAAHHERLDGGGYPRGLKGPDIALETRIITTADIFDAITAERPYRGAVPVQKTLAIMADTVGTAIDADCFAHLKKIIQAHPELFPG